MDLGSVGFMVSLLAIYFSWRCHRDVHSLNMYKDLDRLFFDLLAVAMLHPKFANPECTGDYRNAFPGDEQVQYGLFAFMAWNICESIYDRRHNRELFRTWKPVIDAEWNLHRKWFAAEENHGKFKQSFRDWVNEEYEKGEQK
jgi:hypothetical protein